MLKQLAQEIKDFGGRFLLVGGAVRDQIMEIEPKDFDCEVFFLEPQQFKNFLTLNDYEYKLDNKDKFPVFRIKNLGIDIEIGLPRIDNKIGVKPSDFVSEVRPHLSFKDAAKRRDFTINAIYFDILTEEYIDPYNGIDDIKNKILRVVDRKTFKEDSSRLLRGFQFIARFGLNYEPLLGYIYNDNEDILEELQHIAKITIYQEFEKAILKGSNQYWSEALSFLEKSGVLKTLFPIIQKMVGINHSKHHEEGCPWKHTLLALKSLFFTVDDGKDIKMIMFYGVLLHDIGKPQTLDWNAKKEDYTNYGHARVGYEISDVVLNNLGVPNKYHISIKGLIKNHMTEPFKSKDKTILKKADELASCGLSWYDILKLNVADNDGTINNNHIERLMNILKSYTKINKLGVMFKPLPKLITGKDVIDTGFKQGSIIGDMLKEIRDLQLNNRIKTKEEAVEFLTTRFNNFYTFTRWF